MKTIAIHDHRGALKALVIGPAEDAPSAGLSIRGHLVSVVEAPELPRDLERQADQQLVLDVLRRHEVDLGQPRLVPRN
jgi:hypothetical protein